jgi:hypothetical protein
VVCQHEVPNRQGIAAAKPITVIITVASKLGPACLQIDLSKIRKYSQVLTA